MSAKKLLLLLRAVVVVHVLLVLSQALFAGQFLNGGAGSGTALSRHRFTGTAILMSVALVQCLVAFVCWRRKLQTAQFVLGCVVLYIAEGVQIGVGFARRLELHVPLGVTIFGVALLLAAVAFRRQPAPAMAAAAADVEEE